MKKVLKRISVLCVCATLLIVSLLTPVAAATSGVYELTFDNLFVFEQWANNANSGIAFPSETSVLTKDIATGSFTLTNNSTDSEVYTSHSMGSNVNYYSMPVEANTEYVFSYVVNGTKPNFEAFVFFFDTTGTYMSFQNKATSQNGLDEWSFTTPENAGYIQVRFDNNAANSSVTVSAIRIRSKKVYDYAKDLEYRKTFTYSAGATYGTLPSPQRDNLVFAGWYTGPDGAGERITADTVMTASSYSLYAKWEPLLSGDFSIVSLPVKREYCVGEKLNTKGLAISVTYLDGTTEILDSGFRCSPQVLNQTGTQTITISYGNKTAEFTVNVKDAIDVSISLNGSAITIPMANYKYTLNKSVSAFNRYEISYSSDAYIKGTMLMGGTSEDFFLEPGENETFSGYIDGFLNGTTQNQITSITFTALDKEFMDFTLESISLSEATNLGDSDGMVYLSDTNYKIGIDLDWGGALTYLEDKTNSVMSSVKKYGTKVTEVDFKSKVKTSSLTYNTSSSVNLINCNDTGRLVQQSYYGTGSPPYEIGDYNGTPWNYNPVQGGNVKNEPSKIVDLKVTDNEIYVKCRPLDWGKYSDEFAAANGLEAKYGEDYITPAYMEAWYTLEDGLMRATCRFVDYSGYPEATTTQELPAFYCVEPLNNFVYYSGGEPWSDSNTKVTESALEFWGDHPEQFFNCNENWAAFIGDDADSFGIGLYCPGQTNMYTGVFNRDGCTTVSPATEGPTSYIAAVDTFTFKSFNPFSYAYYITTGNVDTIRNNFKAVATNPTDPCDVGYTNGFCNNCGKYQMPKLTTDKYDLNNDNTFDNVYEISNAGELYWFSANVNNGDVNANAILVNNIVVNENLVSNTGVLNSNNIKISWTPIGNGTHKYNGIFDGHGHTISGLHFNSNVYYAGVFGYTDSKAVIKEVGLTDSYIKADWYVGAICGDNYGTITNCYSISSVIKGNVGAAGISAANESGAAITNCYSTAAMYGEIYVGGICGYNPGTISNCYYLEECAFNSSGVAQKGTGGDTTSFIEDTANQTISKTLAEFNSGEVAYLLQKSNSEQIWGQKSNTKKSAPVIDYTGKYTVNTATDTDGFFLVSIGDIENDNDVDIYDYQQLVNKAVSREKITEYKEMLKSDLDGDGFIDVLDCSIMSLIVHGYLDSVSVYPAGDFDCDGVAFSDTDISAIRKGLLNLDTLSTKEKFACDLNFDGENNNLDMEILDSYAPKTTNDIFVGNDEVFKTKKANVIILAGQSNAYGASPLTQEVRDTVGDTDFSNVKIKYTNINSDDGGNNWRVYYSNNEFETFRLGIGGQADMWFGPEVGLSYYLATNEETKDEEWYIIKCTAAGTYLGGNWLYDTTGQYQNAANSENIKNSLGVYLADGMINLVNADLTALAKIYDDINIRSFMWMQGESDSLAKEWADQYGDLQNILVNRVRTEFEQRDADAQIGFVDGAIAAYNSTYNYWTYSDTVNTHKSNNASLWYVPAATSKNVINKTTAGLYTNASTSSNKLSDSIWIDTSTCKSKLENNNENGENDGAHYCGESMLRIGIWFAQGMMQVSGF